MALHVFAVAFVSRLSIANVCVFFLVYSDESLSKTFRLGRQVCVCV